MQETTTYIFFESVVEPLITKKESRDKMKSMQSPVVYKTTLTFPMVIFCNQIMTRQNKLTNLT